jgi:hypothetical protein
MANWEIVAQSLPAAAVRERFFALFLRVAM